MQKRDIVSDLRSCQGKDGIHFFSIFFYALNAGSKVTVESEGHHRASRNEDTCVGIGRCAQCSVKAQRMRSIGHIFMNSSCGSIKFDTLCCVSVIDKDRHDALAVR